MTAKHNEFTLGLRAGEPRAVHAAERLLGTMARIKTTPSSRQEQVLELVADGYTDGEIALRLWVTEETVKTHMKRARMRLGARNRTHAVVLWLRRRG